MEKDQNNYNQTFHNLPHSQSSNEKGNGNVTNFGVRGEKSSPLSINEIDDLDQMLLHEDFGYYLYLASQLKQMQRFLQKRQSLSADEIVIIDNIMKNIDYFDSENQQVNITKKVIRDKLCNYKRTSIPSTLVLKKGLFPQTDSLMNESINILKQEIGKCYDQIKKENEDKDVKPTSSKRLKTEKGAVAAQPNVSKYSKYQVDVLTNWMIKHREYPYPDSNQIKQLAKDTNLTYNQVVNWMTNVRKRNMKGSIEGGKKPHHFLDFLFLTQERERNGQQQTAMQNYNDNETKKPKRGASKRQSTRKREKKIKTETISPSPAINSADQFSMPSAQMHSQNGNGQLSSFHTFLQTQEPLKSPLFASNSSFSSANSAFSAYTAPTSSMASKPIVTPVYTPQTFSMNPSYAYAQTAFMPMKNREWSTNTKMNEPRDNCQEQDSSEYFKVPAMPPLSPIVSSQKKPKRHPNDFSWDSVVNSVKSPDVSSKGQKRSRAHSFDDDDLINYEDAGTYYNTPPDIFSKEPNLEDAMHNSVSFDSKKKQAMDLFWDLTSFTLNDDTPRNALDSSATMSLKNKCNNLLNDLKSEMVTTTIQLNENVTPSILNNVTFDEMTPKAPVASKRNSVDSLNLDETFLKDLSDDDLLF